ncbi:MAG: hypothetical protein RLZZ179_1176 [Verrucomicrobiota bacterium]
MPELSDSSDSPVGSGPLRLRVRHLTRYDYHGPVTDSYNDLRLCPVSDGLQRCMSFRLEVAPATVVSTYMDFYLNRVDHFELHDPHEFLSIEAHSVVETYPDPRGAVVGEFPAAMLDAPSVTENYFDFLTDSEYVSLEAELWREAVDVLPGGVSDLWRDAVRLGEHVNGTFLYDPLSTHAGTRMRDALRERRGVCQDFAHVLLALCRCQGIPARYVSGYFFNEQREEGAVEASHAWVEFFLPGFGWKGYDPTHRREADTRYVRLAAGRDYADIRPVSGTFRGRGTRELFVDASIELHREE